MMKMEPAQVGFVIIISFHVGESEEKGPNWEKHSNRFVLFDVEVNYNTAFLVHREKEKSIKFGLSKMLVSFCLFLIAL